MSWLTDLTSKAETFLNKIDQSAAEKFNESDILDNSPPTINGNTSQERPNLYIPVSSASSISPPTSSPKEKLFPIKKGINVPLVTKSQSADGKLMKNGLSSPERAEINKQDVNKTRASKKQEELLFEFLNNSETVSTKPKPLPSSRLSTSLRTSPIPVATTTSMNSSRSHSPSVEIDLSSNEESATEDSLTSIKMEDPISSSDETQQKGEVMTTVVNVDMSNRHDERITNLEYENQLLKNEVQSLNEELSRAINQVKEKQEETEKYKMRYENRRNQQNEDYERIRTEYQNKENDLQEALRAKDSQLAVLRVRIQEVDGELKEKLKVLTEVQMQNEQILLDHTNASGVQNVALDSIREKLEETTTQLQIVENENETIKSELMNLQEKMTSEQNQYAVTIKQLEIKQGQEKDKSREFELKVKQSTDDVESAQKELKDYKEKAARILQAKEKLIASLKQGNASDIPPMLVTELEEVKHERDMVREEYNTFKLQTEQLRTEYQELELLHASDVEDSQQTIDGLQSSLEDETTKKQHLEEDLKRYIHDLQFHKEELHKIRRSHVAENQQYEAEIKKLKNQINVKQNISSTQEELENRIRTLTDSLIHKQTVVETLGTEKNSLVLQLERLEKQYYDIQKSLESRNRDKHLDIEDLDGGGRLQSMQSILPSKVKLNKHWKSTANEIDKFSVRFGVFLRRYPAARLMMFVYMLLLHLWVTFVLLTYTPEIHQHEPHH